MNYIDKKVCIVTTMSSSIDNWIKPFINEYLELGIKLTIVCNMTDEYAKNLMEIYPGVNAYPIQFPRGISFGGSIKSINALRKLFKSQKFDLVQYSTPNASVYSSIAARLCKVPVRLYCQWGMLYVTKSGLRRFIFKCLEKMTCRLSTNIQPDSFGNLEFCRENGLYPKEKSCVIWNGSAKGIDLSNYDVSKKAEYAQEIRERYNLSQDDVIIGFVGRLGREKGCNELFSAFKILKEKYSNAKLLFVGPIEKEDTIEPDLLNYFWECDDIIKTDRVPDVEKHMAAMDVFVLPSYREGFGMSVVEASAMKVPVVATKYPGPSGGMKDGVTGYSINIKDTDAIVQTVSKILDDKDFADELAQNGRRFVEENFDQKVFTEKYMENRMDLLKIN